MPSFERQDAVVDDLMAGGRMIEPARITLPIRLALNWAVRGMAPPGLYQMPYGVAVRTIRAFDQLSGRDVDLVASSPPGEEASGDDQE